MVFKWEKTKVLARCCADRLQDLLQTGNHRRHVFGSQRNRIDEEESLLGVVVARVDRRTAVFKRFAHGDGIHARDFGVNHDLGARLRIAGDVPLGKDVDAGNALQRRYHHVDFGVLSRLPRRHSQGLRATPCAR